MTTYVNSRNCARHTFTQKSEATNKAAVSLFTPSTLSLFRRALLSSAPMTHPGPAALTRMAILSAAPLLLLLSMAGGATAMVVHKAPFYNYTIQRDVVYAQGLTCASEAEAQAQV